MSQLNLTPWQRRRLRRQLAETSDVRVYRRTLAVLEFDHGRSAADLARMLGVTCQSIYNWVDAYAQAQRDVDQIWTNQSAWYTKTINNTARMGWFSSDRTIRQYADEIWRAG